MDRNRIFLYFDWVIITCLCLIIFCLPFAKAGIETFTWLAISLWIFKRVLGHRGETLWRLLPKTELNKALGVFIVINALSFVFSSNFELSLRGFFGKELKFLAIYFMLVEVINCRKRLKIILVMILTSVLFIVVDAGVQYFRGVDFLRGYVAPVRLTASFSHANGFAGWLIVIIPLILGLLMRGKKITKGLRVLLFILTMLLTLCLVLTYSRGAWLGFIISIILMFVYMFRNIELKIKAACLFTIIGLLVSFLIFPQFMQNKVISSFNFGSRAIVSERVKSILKIDDASISVRLRLWKEAVSMISDYNLTGCGLNTYSMVARDYKSFEGGGIYSHNSYLQMVAEIGFFGLFSFLFILFSFFKTGFRYLNQRNDTLVLGFLSGILAFLVHAFFDTHFYSLQLVVLFWYMLGLTIAIMKLGVNRNQNSGG